jgi:hypothetical protein
VLADAGTVSSGARNGMNIISYVRQRGVVLYHGTISNADDTPRATWTYEVGGNKRTIDQRVSPHAFESLWNAFSDAAVFARHMVAEPDGAIDPVTSHIITVVFRDEQGDGLTTFAIPVTEQIRSSTAGWHYWTCPQMARRLECA